jgi:hypothetical protein
MVHNKDPFLQQTAARRWAGTTILHNRSAFEYSTTFSTQSENFAHQECADWTLRVHLTFAHRCVRRLMMPASLN